MNQQEKNKVDMHSLTENNKLILFRSNKHNEYTEEANKIALSDNENKTVQ